MKLNVLSVRIENHLEDEPTRRKSDDAAVELQQAQQRAEKAVLEAEKFRAAVGTPGNYHGNGVIEGNGSFELLDIGCGISDDDFFHLTFHIEPSLIHKTLFIAYLVDKGMQSNTVKSYVSAIKKTLIIDSYDWDNKLVPIRMLAKACRIINDSVRTRLPIHCNLLEMILFEVQRYFTGRNQVYLESLYKTLFAISYYGMMRIGEVMKSQHVLKASNVHMVTNKDKLLLLLYSSKTYDQGTRPQKIKIT